MNNTVYTKHTAHQNRKINNFLPKNLPPQNVAPIKCLISYFMQFYIEYSLVCIVKHEMTYDAEI